jgi:mannose-6-phosphate isomerase-like protein (cupin superfamily)
MFRRIFLLSATSVALTLVAAGWFASQTLYAQLPGALPGVEPLHDSGVDVTPAQEGWYKNPDGSFNITIGFNNRNLKQELDIPIGPNNKIEPGPPDQGQPTHFTARRGWGVFTVTVPKDFGTKKITWTLTANGRTNSIPFGLDPRWEIDALKEASVGNTPPVIAFAADGPKGQGPQPLVTIKDASMSTPFTLDVWATDDGKFKGRNPPQGPPVRLTWSKYRGSGTVTFAKAKPDVDKDTHRASTTATFSEPGEYWLRVVANDSSGDGGGGFQCCWTNGIVKVTVAPARATATGAAAGTAPGPVVFRSAAEWATVLADKAKATPTADLVSANVKSGDKYQINIVRRTKPQGAIAHAVGTEIHEILDGTATLVTGGTIVRPASGGTGTATIQNGQTVKVSKGDVVLVPPNTPHWYQSIDGMVTYLEIRFDVGAPAGGPATVLTHTEQERVMGEKVKATPAPLLFDSPLGRGDHFQANVVRRTKAQGGGAHEAGSEVHLIMDGSGTFVTGGTVVRATGQPGTIEGGASRQVQKGDVVLVPAGTPHWYKTLDGTLTYLEVRFDLPTP